MRIRSRLRKVIGWGSLLILTILAGGVSLAYLYVTDGTTLAVLIESEVPRYLPGTQPVLGRVKWRPFAGEINLTHVALRQTIDGVPFQALRIPWLRIRHEARAMLEGKVVLREVMVAQPELRLRRRKDGTWNLQGILADPWPGPMMKTPPIVIQNGTVELAETDSSLVAILRDVSIKVESAGTRQLKFDGTAKGDAFDRLSVEGRIDLSTGRVTLKGDVARLALSETLRGRLPAELRPRAKELGLTAGEIDVQVAQVTYDPKATPSLHYRATAQLRSGLWACPKLPFPINDLSASVAACDGVLTIDRAEGYNGATVVRVEESKIALSDPERAPFDLRINVVDLELDPRLRDWTPAPHKTLWEEFSPSGRLNAGIHAVREREGGPVGFGLGVNCLDVGMLYKHFKYPLNHVRGQVKWQGQEVTLDLTTLVGNKPLRATGKIVNPGEQAHVMLDFAGEALPIDEALFNALPPDIRKVVKDFQPAGTVRGSAHVDRMPRARPTDPPEGVVKIDADLDLNEGCSMRWVGLPYPVMNLTGRLGLHPDRWIFEDMHGRNGQAVITGSGKVEQVGPAVRGGPPPLKSDLHINVAGLPFDHQLRNALEPQPAWKKTWETLDPIGSCDVDAKIVLAPGKPDHYHLVINPGPSSGIQPKFERVPTPGLDPGGTVELRMEDVTGRFTFDNGKVTMNDVGFQFHEAPVRFAGGSVVVEDSGRFALDVVDLRVQDFRLDARLRKMMPPVMADFARRLDDGKTFRVNGDLQLGWSGKPGEPARCRWKNALVVFNDNTIDTGIPLKHLQGELDHVWGHADAATLEVHGALRLDSVNLIDQQITKLESPLDVKDNVARLGDIQCSLLGGEVRGAFGVSIERTPRYDAALTLRGADLQRYTKTIPGRQKLRGLVSGQLNFSGRGNDLRTLQGQGEAHITEGDLGELPVFLALLKLPRFSPVTKTAFDAADVSFRIENGKTWLDPVRFIGDAFSLQGQGTLDVQGDLDLRLRVLLGRDKFHLMLITDALREASGQFFVVRVRGTPALPKPSLEPIPFATELGASALKSIGNRRGILRNERTP